MASSQPFCKRQMNINSFLNVCGTEKYCEMLKRVVDFRMNVCKFPAMFMDICTTFGVNSNIMPYDT